MTSAVSTTFAHRLGRTVGLAVRFCLHDRNPKVRWVKRAIVASVLLALFVTSFTWLISSVITLGCLGLLVLALTKGDSTLLTSALGQQGGAVVGTEDAEPEVPFYGEYEHPDYHMYYKD